VPRDSRVYLEDLEIVWDVVTNKLPGFAQKVKVFLGRN
jgi:uncharacterized protein with HEPN domain